MIRKKTFSILLHPQMFSASELLIFDSDEVKIAIFRFQSGVEAVRVKARRGEFIWLPFLGSQIWDWMVNGVSQKFEGFVSEPSYGKTFLENYGGFLIHCGMTAMGNPSREDTHPQHGELPTARFSSACMEFDPDDTKFPISLCSELHWHVPFVADYSFRPRLRIRHDGLSAIMDGELTNASHHDFPFMYLAHINFPYTGGNRLSYDIESFDSESVKILREGTSGISRGPGSFLTLDAAQSYDPELVAILDHRRRAYPRTHRDHVVNSMHSTKNSAVWVATNIDQLDHTVIWITHTKDRGACGFSMPATAGPTGYASEFKQGNVKVISGGETIRLQYAFGYSENAKAKDVEEVIQQMQFSGRTAG